jgi:hypothetical protein
MIIVSKWLTSTKRYWTHNPALLVIKYDIFSFFSLLINVGELWSFARPSRTVLLSRTHGWYEIIILSFSPHFWGLEAVRKQGGLQTPSTYTHYDDKYPGMSIAKFRFVSWFNFFFSPIAGYYRRGRVQCIHEREQRCAGTFYSFLFSSNFDSLRFALLLLWWKDILHTVRKEVCNWVLFEILLTR